MQVASPCTVILFAILFALIGAAKLLFKADTPAHYFGGLVGLVIAGLLLITGIVRLIIDGP